MSSAPVSAHGFVGVRGRGYRPEQVDRMVAGLSAERDEAQEQVARLTALAEALIAESARLDEAVAVLAPQDYASLGERAQQILALAEGEAEALRGPRWRSRSPCGTRRTRRRGPCAGRPVRTRRRCGRPRRTVRSSW